MRIYELIQIAETNPDNYPTLIHWTFKEIEITPQTNPTSIIIIDEDQTTLTHQEKDHRIYKAFINTVEGQRPTAYTFP